MDRCCRLKLFVCGVCELSNRSTALSFKHPAFRSVPLWATVVTVAGLGLATAMYGVVDLARAEEIIKPASATTTGPASAPRFHAATQGDPMTARIPGRIAVPSHAAVESATNPTGPARPAVPLPADLFEARYVREVQPMVQKYCFGCHGNGKHKGDVSLEKFTTFAAIQSDRPTWENIADQLESESMPPEDKPQPSKGESAALSSFIKDALAFRDCSGPRDPGKVTIRRLNRAEYNNTIRDLLGIDVQPAADFPADDTGYGFDNIADVLSMSPLLAEKYLYAAEESLDRAIVTEGPKRSVVTLDGKKLTSVVPGGYSSNDTNWIISQNGELLTRHEIPATGEYEIRARVYGVQAGPDPVRIAIRVDGVPAKVFEVKALKDAPQSSVASMVLRAGEHKIAIAFLNQFTAKPNPDKPREKVPSRRLAVESLTIDGPKNAARLLPPPPTEMQRKLIFCNYPKDGTEEVCAKKVIAKFATRAFRRPVTDDEQTRLMKLYTAARTAGDKYEKALKTSMAAVLCSPHFLFRIENPPTGLTAKSFTISDYALATRLSYFLWSTMPDDELMSAASTGKLRQPGVVESQIKRMMADKKAQAFVTNFEGQWLELRLLDDYEADVGRFPAFRELRISMKKEVETYFQSMIAEDRSVLELIDSNYTFVDEKLAKFYGLTGVTGENFRKVPLTSADHRGGVLTMAGVLTVTAMPSRTSPVKRGKFVLEQILGTPPPPPPPDVPSLSEKKKDLDSASMRQRLEAHRADPTCASCHKRMDPIGFALENYNAIGQWRDKEGEFAIDPSGVLPGGHKISGPEDLKKALLEKKDGFVRCLVTKMLTYSIGRGIEPYDQCTVDDICASVKQNNYRFSSLLAGIVKSDAFQKRRAE
jgi:hypothetical protein